MNGNYDYTKPIRNFDSRIIEHNRHMINCENNGLWGNIADPNILNSMPIPTNPISMQEARNVVWNAARIESERRSINTLSGGGYSNYPNKINYSNDNSDTNSGGYYGKHPTLIAILLGIIAVAPLVYFIIKSKF